MPHPEIDLGTAADTRIRASVDGGSDVTFEALPSNTYNPDLVWRQMTTVLAVDRKWAENLAPQNGSPTPSPPFLHPGRNETLLKVADVEAPLVGERTDARVEPPLFWYTGGLGNTAIFNCSFIIVPFLMVIQALWALGLLADGA